MVESDRIERKLEELQASVQALAITVATLATEIRINGLVHEKLAEHEKADADVHATLKSEVRRLWWLVGGVASAAFGALIKAFTPG